MRKTFQAVMVLTAAAAAVSSAQVVLAQSFPAKPIRIIVPMEPAGTVDITARTVSPRMSEDLGQPVIVENRSGAAGRIGAQWVARSAPDGYTIMFTVGAHNLFMVAFKELPFHPIKDFTAITVVSDTGLGISAGAGFPANNLKEAIDYAKRNPGKVSYGHTGVGGISHLAMEQIKHLTETDLQHVPFKGGGPLTVNLVGGQIQMGVLPLASVMNQVKAGKIKVLAVLDSKRFAGLPDVMSVNEAVPNFEMLEGSGCWAFGPAGMPAAIVNRLHAAIVKALAFPEVRAKIESGGQTPNGEPPAAAAAKAKTIAELGGRLAKLAGVEPE